MPIRFTVLASGSSGNASLVQVDGFGLLLDAGLGPRQLAARLAAVGASWQEVQAVLLTHTHGDHWRDRTLAHLRRRRIPLYCHTEHHDALRSYGDGFSGLEADDLVRTFAVNEEFVLAPGLGCRAFALKHDSGATFGFRLEQPGSLFGDPAALAYAADLGSWTPELAGALADVDALALEFNHDVEMQYASGRSFQLIRRVLGDHGHLSNVQAADLLREVLRRSAPGRLRHVVQLHLSQQCNRPELALAAARAAVAGADIEVHTACQDTPILTVSIGPSRSRKRVRRSVSVGSSRARQTAAHPMLPGFESSDAI
ncbi:MAG: MBL fold metallo-hydrolase [Gemmataceae bacterium]|nr:MBL fold metallo-hydrolase [Gemmataceae bacterium]